MKSVIALKKLDKKPNQPFKKKKQFYIYIKINKKQ